MEKPKNSLSRRNLHIEEDCNHPKLKSKRVTDEQSEVWYATDQNGKLVRVKAYQSSVKELSVHDPSLKDKLPKPFYVPIGEDQFVPTYPSKHELENHQRLRAFLPILFALCFLLVTVVVGFFLLRGPGKILTAPIGLQSGHSEASERLNALEKASVQYSQAFYSAVGISLDSLAIDSAPLSTDVRLAALKNPLFRETLAAAINASLRPEEIRKRRKVLQSIGEKLNSQVFDLTDKTELDSIIKWANVWLDAINDQAQNLQKISSILQTERMSRISDNTKPED